MRRARAARMAANGRVWRVANGREWRANGNGEWGGPANGPILVSGPARMAMALEVAHVRAHQNHVEGHEEVVEGQRASGWEWRTVAATSPREFDGCDVFVDKQD